MTQLALTRAVAKLEHRAVLPGRAASGGRRERPALRRRRRRPAAAGVSAPRTAAHGHRRHRRAPQYRWPRSQREQMSTWRWHRAQRNSRPSPPRRGELDDPPLPGKTALGAVRKCGSGRSLGQDRQVGGVRGCVGPPCRFRSHSKSRAPSSRGREVPASSDRQHRFRWATTTRPKRGLLATLERSARVPAAIHRSEDNSRTCLRIGAGFVVGK